MASSVVSVPDVVRDTIWRLLDGWRPDVLEPAQPVTATRGDTDISARLGSLSINPPTLTIELADGLSDFFDESNALWNVPLKATLSDGAFLEADLAHPGVSGVEAPYWTITNPAFPPSLWIARIHGKLDGDQDRFLCNLATRRVRDGAFSGQRTHLRLAGRHTYYLVKANEKESFLIVETKDGDTPRREDLYPDFLALQFVLGRALKLDSLLGVNASGKTVAMVGGEYGRDQGSDARVTLPVPTLPSEPAWVAPFFTAISKAYSREELRLYVPLSGYVEALGEAHVEGRCLRLHIALEGFAYWFLKTKPPSPKRRIAEKAKWKEWLNTQEAAIRAIAMPGFEDELLDYVMAAVRRPSGRVIVDAFAEFGIEMGKEMKADLAVRNDLAHTALLFSEPKPEIEAYLRPIALVSTMLVTLLAKVVGYDGPLVGWEREKNRAYGPPPTSWWTVGTQSREDALVGYVADMGDVEAFEQTSVPRREFETS